MKVNSNVVHLGNDFRQAFFGSMVKNMTGSMSICEVLHFQIRSNECRECSNIIA